MRPPTVLLALLVTALFSLPAWSDAPEDLLDSLLGARAASDAPTFLALLAPDAVVLGMGGSGPLSGPDLSSHIDALFSGGPAGDYRSVQREIRYSAGRDVAWFSELLEGPGGSQAWESGVLVNTGGDWKVAQYTTAPVQSTVSAVPSSIGVASEQGSTQPIAPAAPVATAATGQSDTAQPALAEPATAEPVTAEPAREQKRKKCRRMRHKTNKASNC